MRTLYLRNVPDDTVDRLERLAARDGMSVNAVAVRELIEVSRRVDNAARFATIPSIEISTDEIVAAIDAGRDGR